VPMAGCGDSEDGVKKILKAIDQNFRASLRTVEERPIACINVRTEEAYETAHEVLRAEGLFLGTSAAAALHAAVQVGRRPENQGKNIVVIVPDNGMKYLSTPMYRQK